MNILLQLLRIYLLIGFGVTITLGIIMEIFGPKCHKPKSSTDEGLPSKEETSLSS